MGHRAQGLRAWLLQRLSALYMAVYTTAALIWFAGRESVDFETWQAAFAHPLSNIFSQLFIYLLLAHAWVGVRDIFVDYVHHLPTRFCLMVIITLMQIVLAIWVFMAFYAVVRL